MKIVRMLNQIRRDFWADMECENCGRIAHRVSGYDDRNFHDNVIPAMKCQGYGKSRNDIGIVHERTATKYGGHEVV